MATPVFTSKLDTLPATLELFRAYDSDPLSAALADGIGQHAMSVGSGGSAVAAEYLARCRDTLGLGPTSVQTPMQVVLDAHDLRGSDVWLFSAGADNPDVVAAAQAAIDRNARSLHVVTCNVGGAAAGIVARAGGHVHVGPAAESKDGYLATHSLLSATAALLLASDNVLNDPRGRLPLLDSLASRLTAMRDRNTRESVLELIGGLGRHDTIMIASDPRLRPLALMLDTSIWEASLCHAQTADFRNLAHGRHAWMHHRADETLILALTGHDSRHTWSAIEAVLPERPRRLTIDFGACGRLDNALALVDGFGVIEAIGTAVGIDPGKPGIGNFGRAIYNDRSLEAAAAAMPSPIRHKRSVVAKLDACIQGGVPLHEIWRDRAHALATADIGGAVFDYDGTIVTAEGRCQPPTGPIIDEFVRLHRAGCKIGIATGRGGSAGEELRKVLPPEILPSILIGYYNGGHLRTADIDIKQDPPAPDSAIAETAAWLSSRSDLFVKQTFRSSAIQITVDADGLRRGYRFPMDLAECPPIAAGRIRITASGHSYDLVPAGSSKLAVVEALEGQLPSGKSVLRFGDSGGQTGNDKALLSHPFGISVGEVCGELDGCWSLFGINPSGPDAVLRILRAIISTESGMIRLDVASLGLDNR